ncbi:MAG: MFS transporter [Acidimicrobiales bacterium]
MGADVAPGSPAGGRPEPLRLHPWLAPPVLSVALVVVAAGFGQFAATAALGDVATAFGEVADGPSVAEQAGLSGTVLGLGLAVIRLASLASLPLAGLADRHGRRPVVLAMAAVGLALTASAALSPSYWWFVALFALARPFLSATSAVAQVTAAEHTYASGRVRALALVTAGYALGAGLVAVIRGLGAGVIGFRVVFALAIVPLALLPLLGRWLSEPDRYHVAQAGAAEGRPLVPLRAGWGEWGHRLLALVAVAFAVAFVTGPANSFLFVYAENVLDVSPALTAGLVLAALPAGLVGLVLGRWGADAAGRRVTGALALAGIAVAGIVTYSGSVEAAVGGYLLAVLAGAAFAPALAALASELFPTEVRARVAGWLVATGVLGGVGGLLSFGALADAFDGFGPAAVVVALPAFAATLALARLPETRGLELEESAPPVLA